MKRRRLTQDEANKLLKASPSDRARANQALRSERDRWVELSELRVEFQKFQAEMREKLCALTEQVRALTSSQDDT